MEVNATVCDICDLAIDKTVEGYCTTWIHNMTNDNNDKNIRKLYNPVHMIFSFRRDKNKGGLGGDWAKYDFHSECFDNLMIDFFKKKGAK